VHNIILALCSIRLHDIAMLPDNGVTNERQSPEYRG